MDNINTDYNRRTSKFRRLKLFKHAQNRDVTHLRIESCKLIRLNGLFLVHHYSKVLN